MLSLHNWTEVQDFIACHLKPIVSKIDQDGVYPGEFLKQLGEKGAYSVSSKTSGEINTQFLRLIDEVGKVCGTTAFAVWCHIAAIHYARNGNSTYIKENILPLLENGEILGGTGLSNPMKYYAEMEELRLTARQDREGYRVSGILPFVSNLGSGHWFGIIAQVSTEKRIMALVPCDSAGLKLTEVKEFIGLNGSGTYTCNFQDVWIPNEYILSEQADDWVPIIRPQFVLLQIGMALGLIRSSLDQINRLKQKQGGVNLYLNPKAKDLEQRWKIACDQAYRLAKNPERSDRYTRKILHARLEGARLSLEAANSAMLHSGAAGYVKQSDTFRRLREAYFIASVTPAIKQLEKVLTVGWVQKN
jgi:hypothetical protein